MNPLLKVLGLMSGTSLDGLDIALVEIYETRGKFHLNNIAFKTYEYEPELREKILKNLNPASANIVELSDLNFFLGKTYAELISKFCLEYGLKPEEIDLISSHGQTFYHNVKDNKTISTFQLGDPSVIAVETGITTVGDFRTADVAAGGNGAPLVPFLDLLLFKSEERSVALQNIGGISNVAFIPKGSDGSGVIAFDNGPGNMIIDSLIRVITGNLSTYDENGQMASIGKADNEIINEIMEMEYFKQKPPKTTGRELFDAGFCKDLYDKGVKKGLKNEDIIATATFLTAKSIYDSYKNFLPVMPDEIIISGGGTRNLTLIKNLRKLFSEEVEISTIDKYGISPDAKEAVAFAVMGYCSVFGIPNNPAFATMAKKPVIMGKICPGNNFQRFILKKSETDSGNKETTETGNILSQELDELTPLEIVELMNINDYAVLNAVEHAKNDIAAVIEEIVNTLDKGGRLFYIGAGTSGRLGVLDASECPPTFRTPPELVQGIIAGGDIALTTAVEGAEDSGPDGRKDVREKINGNDILIGISANGKAPYVLEALDEVKSMGGKSVLVTCNELDKPDYIDHQIVLKVGPEVLSGSTRLKAGTATKLVLNMFTTGTFAKLGKVYSNYMIDLKVSNKKLKKRAVNIIIALAGVSGQEAESALQKAGNSVKLALLMQLKSISDPDKARQLLEKHKGFLRKALNDSDSRERA